MTIYYFNVGVWELLLSVSKTRTRLQFIVSGDNDMMLANKQEDYVEGPRSMRLTPGVVYEITDKKDLEKDWHGRQWAPDQAVQVTIIEDDQTPAFDPTTQDVRIVGQPVKTRPRYFP